MLKGIIILLFTLFQSSSLALTMNNRNLQMMAATKNVAAKSTKQTVAIIGGGIAGLSCAQALSNSGRYLLTVFDTGRLRPGGRCSSRLPGEDTKKYNYLSQTIIDHAAQIINVAPDTEFKKQITRWEEAGHVKQFKDGTVCDISNPYDPESKKYDKTQIKLTAKNTNSMYYGANGMQSLPEAMSKNNFEIQQDVWVSPNKGVKLIDNNSNKGISNNSKFWQIKTKGSPKFDKLVIAHNGKCADRLMSSTPAKDLHQLLRVNFSPTVPKNGGNRMTLNSIYSLTFAIDKLNGIPENIICAFIKNHPNLKFLSCNTRKYPTDEKKDFEVWTVLSSAKFGKAYKGPQENLPPGLVQNVTSLLYESLEQSLALPEGTFTEDNILESRLQLWGAGVPLNTWKTSSTNANVPNNNEDCDGFLYDGQFGVGVCGDWLVESSIYGAWESGRRLAQYLAENTNDEESKVGLKDGKFRMSAAVDKAGIGSL